MNAPTLSQEEVTRIVDAQVKKEKLKLLDYLITVAQADPKNEVWRALFAEMRHNVEERK